MLREKSACFGCLLPGHNLTECSNKSKCSDTCELFHHPSLHDHTVSGSSHAIMDSDVLSPHPREVLLPIMKVTVDSKERMYLSCLWDTGADISLITNSTAKRLKLNGRPTRLSITTAGGHSIVADSYEYKLRLRDKHQNVRILR